MGKVQLAELWGGKRSSQSEERVCRSAEGGVVMKSWPSSAFKVIEADLAF